MRPFKLWVAAIGLKLAVFVIVVCRQETPSAMPIPSAEDVKQAVFENIQYEDGFLLLRDTLLEIVVVVPADIPWSVKCGFGFTVAFGRDREASFEVHIAPGHIPNELCRELAPVVARAVAMIAAGEANVSPTKRLDLFKRRGSALTCGERQARCFVS